jgi:hypothetical protein
MRDQSVVFWIDRNSKHSSLVERGNSMKTPIVMSRSLMGDALAAALAKMRK